MSDPQAYGGEKVVEGLTEPLLREGVLIPLNQKLIVSSHLDFQCSIAFHIYTSDGR